MKKYTYLIFTLLVFSCQHQKEEQAIHQSSWSQSPAVERHFAGGDYWLNPLQAWQQKAGKLEVVASGGDRNCVLLTYELNDQLAAFQLSVDINSVDNTSESTDEVSSSDQAATDGQTTGNIQTPGWVGFQLGLKGQYGDYRDDAIHGRGLCLGLTTDGILFIGSIDSTTARKPVAAQQGRLAVEFIPEEGEIFLASLTYTPVDGDAISINQRVHASWLQGLVALTCSQVDADFIAPQSPRPGFGEVPELGKKRGGNTLFQFSNWQLEGEKLTQYPERSYGPILWAQHTVSDYTMKMSVQLMPIGNDNEVIELIVDGNLADEAWIDKDGNNAIFRVGDWKYKADHSYTIRYTENNGTKHLLKGTIPAAVPGDQLKVASMSCVDDVGFPHQDLVDNVKAHDVDLYVFHGDQIYERVGGYGVERKSKLDYLRKWYIFGWSFAPLFKDRPVVMIPDDHDVFHGNLWGEGGKLANIELGYGYNSQDDGGYKERPDFVNMVHRTQTGHLPDPYAPAPAKNDISVYFTNMNYKGVSFAILGDRQWKSAPKGYLPAAEIENGWPQNKSWNAKTDAFHPEVELLGLRQEQFLENWVSNWSESVYMKAVISQSPFCNVATLPADIYHDKYVPSLKKYKIDEYPQDDRPVADFDSNGWPQNKRDKAIRIIRQAFALHFTGDQHLGSTGRYGVDKHDDGGYWISSPAVSNLWPRRWYPAEYGLDGKPENAPRYTGKYEDGFGNKITVKAIANPHDIDREPSRIFDKAPGYSIIEFDIKNRSMNLAVWPRWAGPSQELDNQPYSGWPITVPQLENYGRERVGYLDPIEVDGETLVAIYQEDSGELVYALKPPKGAFEPFVFESSATYFIEASKGMNVVEAREGQKVR
ncbi:MAG: twin-arginine translocation pathway signal protein [Bacteroidota bacterium]